MSAAGGGGGALCRALSGNACLSRELPFSLPVRLRSFGRQDCKPGSSASAFGGGGKCLSRSALTAARGVKGMAASANTEPDIPERAESTEPDDEHRPAEDRADTKSEATDRAESATAVGERWSADERADMGSEAATPERAESVATADAESAEEPAHVESAEAPRNSRQAACSSSSRHAETCRDLLACSS